MAAFVIDTNVPIAANGSSHANPECVIACIDMLTTVQATGMVVLDNGMLILEEYLDHLSLEGQPGAGDAFMKWVWNVQGDESICERVTLNPTHDGAVDDFIEFPDDDELNNFDRSDRKFVAVALGSSKEPIVLNALDSDWAHAHAALERNGLSIRFLCPQHVAPR